MKTALITGARSGIAGALARLLSDTGWQVALASRDAPTAANAANAAAAANAATAAAAPAGAVMLASADVSTETGAAQALREAAGHFGAPPSAVINCAGSTLIAPITRTSEAQYRAVLSANLDTCFFVAKAYAAALAGQKQPGALVLFSSVVAGTGVANHAAIAAAKGGVEALTRALAADYSALGLRVNCIAPGLTRTPMTQRMLANEASVKQVVAQYPLGRHGEADDAAALAAFLVSDAAGWITGQVIGLDGGFGAVRPYVKAS